MHSRHPARFLRTFSLLLALAAAAAATLALAAAAGCKDPDGGGPVDPYPAPGFSLPDFNPYSATWNEERSVADEAGKVLVVYFASFS